MQILNSAGIWKKVQDKKAVLWIMAFYAVTDLIALALGVGYLLTVIGLHGFTRLVVIYSEPARKKFFIWLSKNQSFYSPPPSLTLWRVISITLNSIVYGGMIIFGVWMIVNNTFCQQNLICLFMQNR